MLVTPEATYPEHPAWSFIQDHRTHTLETFSGHLIAARDAGQALPMTGDAIQDEIRGLIALMDGLELQWLLDPRLDLVAVFTRLLQLLINRWTGLTPDEVETLTAKNKPEKKQGDQRWNM